MPRNLKVYIWPDFGAEADPGDGGVRRVVEAQRQLLPGLGIDVVPTVAEADVLAAHMVASTEMLRSNKPLASHNHGFYWSQYEWGTWAGRDNAALMQAIRRSSAVSAPSDWVANIIRRHTSRDVETIYHGVEVPDSPMPASDGYVLWNKTRVDPICDPTPVVELAARLPDLEFRATVQELAGKAPNIIATPKLPYLLAVDQVQRAGVYLATTRETFGIGTLEAMAAGVPVVGFAFGGQNEIITHGQDGYLARPGDFDDLARGVRWALQYRDQVGAWARRTARRFSWPTPMYQYANMYTRIATQESLVEVDGFRDPTIRREPRVSIIVPCFNMARFLPDALASIAAQTDRDFEVIIVDDASTDDSAAIAIDWQMSNPDSTSVDCLHENGGLAAARNAGIRSARGRYILPLDADDQLAPEAVGALADALDADRNVSVAYGGVLFVDEDGRTPTQYAGGREAGRSGWPIAFDLEEMFRRPGQPLPYASMYRREAWSQTGGYRSRVRSSEDCDFWCRLGSYGFTPKMVTQATTLIYRNRPDSMSRAIGWADVENKTWFPWRGDVTRAPAAGQPGLNVLVPAYDPPVVSVVIPVGPGHEELLLTAIDSVEAQTFRSWEVIVANDTGHDLPELPTWVRVIDVYGRPDDQPAYLLFVSSPHAGVSKARNAGIAEARGLLVLPLDADDYLMPNCLEAMVAAWRAGDPKTIVYSDFWQTPQDGSAGDMTTGLSRDFAGATLLQGALHSVTALMPIAAWRDVGGYESDVPWEDWDLQFKLYAEAGYCGVRLATPLWVYRKHTGQRRLDRYDRREAGKADVLRKWGEYIEGRKMPACASCAARTVYPTGTNSLEASRNAALGPVPQGMVKVSYIGDRNGRFDQRGAVSRTMYDFQKGRPRYVEKLDADNLIASWPDMFALTDDAETAGAVLIGSAAPAILAHEHAPPPPPMPADEELIAPPLPTPTPDAPVRDLVEEQRRMIAAAAAAPAPLDVSMTPSTPPGRPQFDPDMGPPPAFEVAGGGVLTPVAREAPPTATAPAVEAPSQPSAAPEEAAAADTIPVDHSADAGEMVRTPFGDNGDIVDPADVATPAPAAPARATRPQTPRATATTAKAKAASSKPSTRSTRAPKS